MNTANYSQRMSTTNHIRQLGLPATQQRKALETIAWVDALVSTFFTEPEARAEVNKPKAIKPVLKSQ